MPAKTLGYAKISKKKPLLLVLSSSLRCRSSPEMGTPCRKPSRRSRAPCALSRLPFLHRKRLQLRLFLPADSLRFFFSPEIACNSGGKPTSGARRRLSQLPVTAVLSVHRTTLAPIVLLLHKQEKKNACNSFFFFFSRLKNLTAIKATAVGAFPAA
ncbi:hypothetical protein U1Q18_003786 [Sarracenia purpurea var. burkii]